MGIVQETVKGQPVTFSSIIVGSVCIILTLFGWSEWLLAIPIAICGAPIVWGAITSVLLERDITADVLVSVAIVASILIGEYSTAAEVAVIMQIGGFLEEATVGHANSCIMHLQGMRPTTARVVRDGKAETVPVESVVLGDILRILPGETVPADGTVVSGSTSVDMSLITGEPVPADVGAGDRLSAGTQNLYGSVDMRVDRVPEDSTLIRMARLIEQADAGSSRIVRAADRWARYIVVISFTIAVLTYLLTWDIYRSVTVLVVFCPCALILATPTAIMAAAGNLSRHGVLVKDGGALERLSSVDTVIMDKTGTLTTGKFECVSVVSLVPSITSEELARLVASVESLSEHPLGKAIASVSDGPAEVTGFSYIPGKGVSGTVDGRMVYAGNRAFVKEVCPAGHDAAEKTMSEEERKGFTAVAIGVDGVTVGYALLSDTVRDDSEYAVRHLHMLGMNVIILTGDSEEAAVRVSDQLGTDDVVWSCLPSDKLRIVSVIDDGAPCCMVGDGVNDAPSLKRARVGISMCGLNNDIAMESSDIIFVENDLSKFPGLVNVSRRTLKTIHIGIAFSLILNSFATALAVLGLIGPIAGALVHNIGSVLVIIAAAMLLRYDPWRPGRHRKKVARAVSV